MRTFDIGGRTIKLILPATHRDRLSGTCFRGRNVREAGNFHRWSSFRDIIFDNEFMSVFLDILRDIVEQNKAELENGFMEPVTVDLGKPVGWTSTLPLEHVPQGALRRDQLNGSGSALFVVDKGVLAPQTSIVSMTVSFRHDLHRQADIAALVHTIYPGPHVGRVSGDMTDRTGLVWFDFRHPGGKERIELEL